MSEDCRIQKAGESYKINYDNSTASIYCPGGDVAASEPNAPYDLVATPSNGQVSLTWAAPNNGGSAITDYKVEYSINGNFWTTFADGTSTNTTATVTSLTNGTLYVFRVSAINAIGTSNPSEFSNPVKPFTVPSAPSIVSLVRLAGSGVAITVTWSAPASNGGSPIIQYDIYYSGNGGSSWSIKTVPGDTLSTIVDGLIQGQPTIFKIVAINAAGAGTFSSNSNPITPATIPATPTIQSTTIGDSQLTLAWAAPVSDGGTSIIDYIVQYSTDFSNWTTFNDGTSTSTSATITGLTNGTTYFLRVAAVNAVGAGQYSSLSSLAYGTPGTVPGSPTAIQATAGDSSASLTWIAPTSNGGYAITEYRIQYSINGGSSWVFLQDTSSSNTSITINSLNNGTSYTFRIAAKNDIGYSSYSSNSNEVTPNTTEGNITTDYCIAFIDEAHPLYVKGSGNVGALWCADVAYYNNVMSSYPSYTTILFDVDTPFVARGTYKGQPISSDPFYIYPTGVNSSNLESCYLPIPEINVTGIARPSGGVEYDNITNAIGSISANTFASGIVNAIDEIWGSGFWDRMENSYNATHNRKSKLWIARGTSTSLGSGVLASGIEIFQNYTTANKNWLSDQTEVYINECGERYLGWIPDCIYSLGDKISCYNMTPVPNITQGNQGATSNDGDRLVKFYIDPVDYEGYIYNSRCSGTFDDQFDGNPFYEGFSLKLHPLFSCTGIYSSNMVTSFNSASNNNLLAEWRFDSFTGSMDQNPAQRENYSRVYEGKAYLTYENQVPYITVGVAVWDDIFVQPSNAAPGTYYIWKTSVPLDKYGVPSGVIEETYVITSGRMNNDTWVASSYDQSLLTSSLGFPTSLGPVIEPGTSIPDFPNIQFVSSSAGLDNIDSCNCLSLNN
jgi:hypothetical protein